MIISGFTSDSHLYYLAKLYGVILENDPPKKPTGRKTVGGCSGGRAPVLQPGEPRSTNRVSLFPAEQATAGLDGKGGKKFSEIW